MRILISRRTRDRWLMYSGWLFGFGMMVTIVSHDAMLHDEFSAEMSVALRALTAAADAEIARVQAAVAPKLIPERRKWSVKRNLLMRKLRHE